MKSIMYHYVRRPTDLLPYLRYLHVDNFCLQLDELQSKFQFPSFETFLDCIGTGNSLDNAVVLTFDDGFADHYHHVFPELQRRGLWGFFFPAAEPYQKRRMLDVHRIHMLTARHKSSILLEALEDIIEEQMLDEQHSESFKTKTYKYRDDEEALTRFKRILNYFIGYDWRESVIDRLADSFLTDAKNLFDRFYLSADQMREMRDGGMIFGGHSVTHRVMSKLSTNEQKAEIDGSFSFLEDILGPLPTRTFCYPYGGGHTFQTETIALLKRANCRLGFSVGPRDIERDDLRDRPLALPRYDCTMFPYGTSENG